ncbi:hypothetical protein JCM10213_004097 [Rhodosporidiobolus nylandii]
MATAPPPSPGKRNILRTLLTGVNPVDAETHEQRWGRSTGGPASTKQTAGDAGAQGQLQNGGRVAGLVQGWEASLSGSSRPYSSFPAAPPSPVRASSAGASPALSIPQPHPNLRTTQSASTSPSSPSSPLRGTSPTVPASFFQAQQARRGQPSSPTKPSFQPQQQPGKENQPRPTTSFNPSPRPVSFVAAHYARPAGSDSSRSPTTTHDSLSSGTDVSQVTSAFTDLTVETMATRSSNSTHASSLAANSAENAYVGVASRMNVGSGASPRKVSAPQAVGTPNRRERVGVQGAPQIVETAPTPARKQREGAPAPAPRPISVPGFASNPSSQPSQIPYSRPAPDNPYHQRAPPLRPQTSFIEHLPPSSPTRYSPEPRPLQQEGALPSPTLRSNRFSPLPLEHSPMLQQGEQAPAQPVKTRGRPRASSLGAGLKPQFREEAVQPETPEQKRARVELEFENLLDTMQLPDRTVRLKMLGLAFPLKEEMLRSAQNPPSGTSSTLAPSRPKHTRGRSLNLAASQPPSATPAPSGKKEGSGSGFKSTFMRKTRSNSSLREKAAKDGSANLSASTSGPPASDRSRRPSSHSRTAPATSILFRSFGKSSGAYVVAAAAAVTAPDAEDATFWAIKLRTTKCASLVPKELGKLRGRLRTEAPVWVDEFIKSGGYLGLLERLKELLEMEWREEQHDDQVLYEVLRCFKGLTMTACGKRALASHSPTPFLPIASLLFSEKRPGDLPCRQLLVELLLSVFEICPSSSDALPKTAWATPEISLEPAPTSPSFSSGGGSGNGSGAMRRYTRKAKSGDDDDDLEREEVLTPERVQQAHRFAVSLMQGPPDEKEEAKVDFVKAAVRPRVFKTWVDEIASCVRDYFWIFCHNQNLFWTLEQIDADAVEAPKVPSGMTGGVEYEAMAYCAAHFRLINAIARTCPTIEAAFAFHNQLFESGFERVLFTLRRASLVYYQSLHLEMSRYISLARSARFNLGARILQCLDRRFLSREELMVLQQVEQRSYQSRTGAPQIGAVF